MTELGHLIGTWKVVDDPVNPEDETYYVFDLAGHLNMTFRTKSGTQYIRLTYRAGPGILDRTISGISA